MPAVETPSRATALQLYVVRHGETAWSLSGQHTGRTDIPLTAHGEDEARALAPSMRAIGFDHVFTSPAERARKTCDLAGMGCSATIEDDLAEWDYGDYEGRRSVAIRMARPDWNVYRDGCPGGESPRQVSARADRLIRRMRRLQGKIALFSHGQFSCSLAARWVGLPLVQARHLLLGTACYGVLGYNPDHPSLPVLASWNISAAASIP